MQPSRSVILKKKREYGEHEIYPTMSSISKFLYMTQISALFLTILVILSFV